MNTCKNCGYSVSGNFCANCGQDTGTDRVTKKYIVHEIIKLFANVQSGKMYLTKQLFSHPGSAAKGYIEGKRKKYYNPIQFYLGTTAITIFLFLKLDSQSVLINNMHESEKMNGFLKDFINLIYSYFNIAEFLLLPVLSLFTYILFKRTGYNYAEMFILNTYASAQRQIVNFAFIILIFFFPSGFSVINNISIAVLSLFFIWFYIDFFNNEKRITVIIRSIAVLIFFYAGIMLLFLTVFLVFFYKD